MLQMENHQANPLFFIPNFHVWITQIPKTHIPTDNKLKIEYFKTPGESSVLHAASNSSRLLCLHAANVDWTKRYWWEEVFSKEDSKLVMDLLKI